MRREKRSESDSERTLFAGSACRVLNMVVRRQREIRGLSIKIKVTIVNMIKERSGEAMDN